MRTLSSDCKDSIGKRSDYNATAAIGFRSSHNKGNKGSSYLIEAGYRADAESMMRSAGGDDNVVLTHTLEPFIRRLDGYRRVIISHVLHVGLSVANEHALAHTIHRLRGCDGNSRYDELAHSDGVMPGCLIG